MSDLSKKNVRGGGLPSAKFDWQSHTAMTTQFGAFLPVKTIRLHAGDSLQGNVTQQSWLAPLPAPVFGKFKNNTRMFVTKFSRILKHYNDMLAGNYVLNPYTGDLDAVNHVPYFMGFDIISLFMRNCAFGSGQDAWDSNRYMYSDSNRTSIYLDTANSEIDLFNDPNIFCYPVEFHESEPTTNKQVRKAADFYIDGYKDTSNSLVNPFYNILDDSYFGIYANLHDEIELGDDITIVPSYCGFRFTRVGKLVYSLLLSLGYKCSLNYDANTASIPSSGDDMNYIALEPYMIRTSILPLLGYVKAYTDWILPSQYYNDSVFVKWRKFDEQIQEFGIFDSILGGGFADYFPQRSVFTDLNIGGSSPLVNGDEMFDTLKDVLLCIIRSYYTQDYFMSAYKDMVEPGISAPVRILADDRGLNRIGSDVQTIGDYENDLGSDVANGSRNHIANYQRSAGIIDPNNITQFALLSVGRLQDMLLSGLIGGTKIQDWLKNEFGITPSKDSMMLSDYEGCDEKPVFIGDIYAQSSSANSPGGSNGNYLGEVGGRGIINTQDGYKVDYSTNEDCFVYICHELVSVPFYYQGLSDDVLETGRYDFYNPRFDGIGFDPVSHIEMFNYPISINEGENVVNPFGDKPFGWQPTYSRKKIPHDDLLGDFSCPARNVQLLPWFVSRDFSRSARLGAELPSQIIDKEWQSALTDTRLNNFDRIFYVNDGYIDPIRSLFVCNLTRYSHMLPIRESFDFTSGKDSITNSNGSVLNN